MGKELQYPKGEEVWMNFKDSFGKLVFILTSKESRDFYYLYELVDGKFVKLGKAKEPPDLIRKYNVNERIHNG